MLADPEQRFMRALGLELGEAGPKCQRFAGVVDNGILLRLKVEAKPGDLKLTNVQGMLKAFKARGDRAGRVGRRCFVRAAGLRLQSEWRRARCPRPPPPEQDFFGTN